MDHFIDGAFVQKNGFIFELSGRVTNSNPLAVILNNISHYIYES